MAVEAVAAADAILVVNKGIWQGTAPQEAVVVAVAAVISPDLVAAAVDLVVVVVVVTATIVESLGISLENAQPMLD